MSERLLVVERELPAQFHSEACLSANLPTLGENRSNRSDTPSCPVSSFNVQQLNMIDCLVAVGYWVSLKSTGVAIGTGLWETVSMAKKRTKLDRSQRQSDRSEKRLNGTRREAAKKNARADVNQAVERIVRK